MGCATLGQVILTPVVVRSDSVGTGAVGGASIVILRMV